MNQFFDYIQPTIIKTSDNKELPEHLRNRFLLNFNVFGIKYFEQYYLLSESDEGVPYLIMNEQNWGIELENNIDGFDKILDIPRLYIDITDKFIESSDIFRSFIFQAIIENSIYVKGIEGFEAGKDYWLNTTLYNYLANTNQIEIPNFEARLPNYMTEHIMVSKYFDDLSMMPYKDYTNLEYYNRKNHILDNKFSEEELLDFYKNFCSLILKYTFISDELKNKTNNQIYDAVLNYFANYQNDNISNMLNLILNNNYAKIENSTKSCSCNSTFYTTTGSQLTETCSQMYESAMILYLKQMLGDLDFYKDWFMIPLSEYDYIVNDTMIEQIKIFINEFIGLDIDLDFTDNTIIHSSFSCNHDKESNIHHRNFDIIINYLKLIDFVYKDELIENTNKIKIYGEMFGELLPNLQF